jgi:hypothetical protein
MNAPVDEAAEERKGGAGEIAKMLLSAGDSQVGAKGGSGSSSMIVDCSSIHRVGSSSSSLREL